MNEIDPLILRIATAYEAGGAEAAQKALAAYNAEAAKSAPAGKAVATGGMDASRGLGILGQAAGAASGNLGSVSSLLAGLTRNIPAIAGPIAAAGGAFMAWADAVGKINAALEGHGKNLRDIQAGNFAGEVKRLQERYDELTASIDRAADATAALKQVEDEKRAADRAAEDASIALQEQEALAKLDPADDLGRRRVEAQFGARRSALGAARKGQDSATSAAALRAQADIEAARAAAADAQSTESFGLAGKAQRKSSDLVDISNRKMNRWWMTDAMSATAGSVYQPEIEKYGKEAQGLLEQSKAAKKEAEQARAAAELLRQRADIAGQGANTAAVSGRAASVASSIAMGEIDRDAAAVEARRQAARDAQAEAARVRAQIAANESQVGDAQADARREGAEAGSAADALSTAAATPTKGGRIAKESHLQALRAALAREQEEARKANADAIAIVQQATATNKELAARLRELESRVKSAGSDLGQGD